MFMNSIGESAVDVATRKNATPELGVDQGICKTRALSLTGLSASRLGAALTFGQGNMLI